MNREYELYLPAETEERLDKVFEEGLLTKDEYYKAIIALNKFWRE